MCERYEDLPPPAPGVNRFGKKFLPGLKAGVFAQILRLHLPADARLAWWGWHDGGWAVCWDVGPEATAAPAPPPR